MFKIRIDPESLDFRRGSLFSLAGLALELLGAIADIPRGGFGFSSPVALAATVTGAALLVVGVYYLARSKGRSPAWALLGLLSLVGWILVAFMEDRSEDIGDVGVNGLEGVG